MTRKKTLEKQSKSSVEDVIQLRPEEEWENEDRSETEEDLSVSDLSDTAISYLAQIQDLQEQLEQEYLKVQRLEMAIKGFSMALQEEIEKGQ
jgi:N-dimethylarginine dimethylaminohydrolase